MSTLDRCKQLLTFFIFVNIVSKDLSNKMIHKNTSFFFVQLIYIKYIKPFKKWLVTKIGYNASCSIVLKGRSVERVSSYKYLGIMINCQIHVD